MPLGIVLQDENGQVIERLADRSGGVSRLISDFENGLLGQVDPYGDTVFNRVQAAALLQEWAKVEERASAAERELCTAIRQFIQRVALGPHLYLKFVGD
jgi:hypothetical protein